MPDDLKRAILAALEDDPNGSPTDLICHRAGETPQGLGDAFEGLKSRGQVLGFAGRWFTNKGFSEGAARFLDALKQWHTQFPTEVLVRPQSIAEAAHLSWRGKPLDRIVQFLAQDGKLVAFEDGIRLPQFRPEIPTRKRELLDRVISVLKSVPLETPNPHEIARSLSVPAPAVEEMLELGVRSGEIVRLSEAVYYTPEQLDLLREQIQSLGDDQELSASTVRDALGTTRKYAVALLTYLFPR